MSWRDIVLLRQKFCVLAWIVDLILDFEAADRAFGVIANADHYVAGWLPWFGYRLGNWRFLPNLNHDLAPFALDLWHAIAPIVHGNVTTASSNSISQQRGSAAVWSPNLSLLRYLNRLKKRMQDWGFPPDDPLWLFVCHAENAMHELHVDVYYRSVAGCAMPPAEPPTLGISNRSRWKSAAGSNEPSDQPPCPLCNGRVWWSQMATPIPGIHIRRNGKFSVKSIGKDLHGSYSRCRLSGVFGRGQNRRVAL